MAEIYYDADAKLDLIRNRKIAVLGYGNQGHAHALNLRDSGCTVRVGLRPGPSWSRALKDDFEVTTAREAADWADLVSLLLPEQDHRTVYEESVRPALHPGKLLMVAHGFSIHSQQLKPPDAVDVALVAPVGPGHMMRRLYRAGLGEPALLAVYQDPSGSAAELALAYAAALGCTRAGVVRTTFAEETEANLFGEQAVLCGGVPDLIKAGFNTLVEAGYQPEVAYFECVHTVKLIVDLIYEGGFPHMRSRISDTAAYGSFVSGARVVDEHAKKAMHELLKDVQNGVFTRQWVDEYEAGAEHLKNARREEISEEIETVGSQLRSMMGWLRSPSDVVEQRP
jgi:ketol-acid reductoisomerase